MQTPYNPEGKTVLQRHQDCIKEIYACNTAEAFDAIPKWIDQYALPDKNIETMQTVITNQRRLLKVDPAITWSTTRAEQLVNEYKEIDAENFPTPTPKEIAESGITIEVSGGTTKPVTVTASDTIIDPLDSIPEAQDTTVATPIIPEIPKTDEWVEEKPKRTRKIKDEWVQQTQSITLKRRINLPIENVQYSNNEFGCEVTASTKEEAQSILEELMTEFMSDSWLVRKSTMNEMIAIEKNKAQPVQTKEVEKIVEKVVYQRSPDDDLELRRYARVQLFMQALAKDPTILPAMQRIKAEFEVSNPKF